MLWYSLSIGLYLNPLFQGETLATKEATDAFFAMTKLFQSNDIVLRRLVYLGIKVFIIKYQYIVAIFLTLKVPRYWETPFLPGIMQRCRGYHHRHFVSDEGYDRQGGAVPSSSHPSTLPYHWCKEFYVKHEYSNKRLLITKGVQFKWCIKWYNNIDHIQNAINWDL